MILQDSTDEALDAVKDGVVAEKCLDYMKKLYDGEVELVFHKPESPL